MLAGIERVSVEPGITVVTPFDFEYYPFSHRLLMSVLWGGALILLYRGLANRTFPILGALVASHWVLDWNTHRPDLPLLPGSDYLVGLGLWNYQAGTLLVEIGLFVVGVLIYSYCTVSRDRIGTYGFLGLVLFLIMAYINSVFGAPPPDDPIVIGLVTISTWLVILWAFWIDRHRRYRS